MCIKNNPNGNYVLKNDIDLYNAVEYDFEPFNFCGSLNGEYHSIKNFNLESLDKFAGLFLTLEGATIKNLTLNNFQIYGLDNSYCGALAGCIKNCCLINLNIILNNNYIMGNYVGTLAGKISNSTVANIYIQGGNLVGINKGEVCGEIIETTIDLSQNEILKPSEPTIPDEPIEKPVEPPKDETEEPVEPKPPIDELPTEPVVPENPSEPIVPIEPVEPSEPNKPVTPTLPDEKPNSPNKNQNVNFPKISKKIIILLSVLIPLLILSVVVIFLYVFLIKFKKKN